MSKTTTDQIVKRIWKEAYLCNVPDHERLIQEFCDQQTSELKAENERLKERVRVLTIDNMTHEYTEAEIKKFMPEYDRMLLEPLITTLSLIRPLAFRDPNDAAWAMEEIRKVLNAYDKNK